jgi:XapX domain-containing protein
MVPYLVSLGVGLGVGVAYGLLGVRSPAPPIIALLGLLGMLAGEMAVSWLRGHPEVFSAFCHKKSFEIASADRRAEPAAPADPTRNA